MSVKRIGIVVGGGPSPGTNAMISAIAIEAHKVGAIPIGFHDGFEWLAQRYTDEQHEMTIDEVSRIYLNGGVALGTSRIDISRDPQALENSLAALKKLGINALIVIGGDDVISSVIAIERESQGQIRAVLVPKSIDNDLYLPTPAVAPGYETARHLGVEIVNSLIKDARTTGRWYFAVTMGRPSGHLTLGIGKAVSATCTVIPEEFKQPIVSLSDIADIIEGSIIKCRALGRSYGVVLLAEALVEKFDPREVAELQDVDRDAQGNIRVTEIDLGRKVKNEVQMRLEQRGIKVTIVDKTIGYELRCAQPVPYDVEYARELGYSAVNYLLKGGSAAMITTQNGEFKPIPLSEMFDLEKGRGKQRMVDTETENYRVARDYMVRLEPKDFVDPVWVETLAKAGGLTIETFLQKFGKFAK
ncbi:MAG: 6-phosphofructokinase [Blastocatellia bacterium]|nr:6-phosphofructokinase [Blastocatellia bacterium]